MSRLRSLRTCSKGATAIEFAVLAPVFLAFLLGLIEVSRVLWTTQVIQRAAHETARCFAIVAADCSDEDEAKQFAADIGRASGVVIPTSAVSAAGGIACDGIEQNRVSITVPFRSVVPKMLPLMPTEISSVACFPKMWTDRSATG